jgi:uncharacterized integral membrane protein
MNDMLPQAGPAAAQAGGETWWTPRRRRYRRAADDGAGRRRATPTRRSHRPPRCALPPQASPIAPIAAAALRNRNPVTLPAACPPGPPVSDGQPTRSRMFRLILAIVATVSAVVFVMANTHRVELSFVVGSPVRVRLIFLLMLTFLAGLITTWLWGLIAQVRWSRRVRSEVRQERAAVEAADDQDQEQEQEEKAA